MNMYIYNTDNIIFEYLVLIMNVGVQILTKTTYVNQFYIVSLLFCAVLFYELCTPEL
jgi:hypothetical protein